MTWDRLVELAKERRSSNRRYLRDWRFPHQIFADKFIVLIIYSYTFAVCCIVPHLELPSKSEWAGINCWLMITCDAMFCHWLNNPKNTKHKLYDISTINSHYSVQFVLVTYIRYSQAEDGSTMLMTVIIIIFYINVLDACFLSSFIRYIFLPEPPADQ